MSMNVAVVGASGEVVNVKVCGDDYEPEPYEVIVQNAAWIGGDYVGGYFYPPQPYPTWTRHEGSWLPPVPMPTDDFYVWDEDAQEWQAVTQ